MTGIGRIGRATDNAAQQRQAAFDQDVPALDEEEEAMRAMNNLVRHVRRH